MFLASSQYLTKSKAILKQYVHCHQKREELLILQKRKELATFGQGVRNAWYAVLRLRKTKSNGYKVMRDTLLIILIKNVSDMYFGLIKPATNFYA